MSKKSGKKSGSKSGKSGKKSKSGGGGSVRERVKQSSGSIARRLDPGETAEVRFLYELDDSRGWQAHACYFDQKTQRTVYIDDGDNVPRKAEPRDSYFALAFDVKSGSVDVWEFRKTLADELVRFEEDDFGTIRDRNYKIRRRGEGMNTKYSATPQSPSPLTKKMKRARDDNATAVDDVLAKLRKFSES